MVADDTCLAVQGTWHVQEVAHASMSEGLKRAIVRAAAIGHFFTTCCGGCHFVKVLFIISIAAASHAANDGTAGADALALDTRSGHEHRDSP